MITRTPLRPSASVHLALLAGALLVNDAAMAQQRVQCGTENGRCAIGDAGLNRVYYGADGRAVMFEVEGPMTGCHNGVRGDFAHGARKTCAYEPVRNPRLSGATFRPCSKEGDVCRTNAAADAPVFVRYGTPGRWLYDVAAGDAPCTNGHAGFDPAHGTTKVCEIGPRYFDAMATGSAVDWIARGAEGTHFRIGARPTLVRYGAPGRGFVYRQIQGDPSKDIGCNNGTFGRDPAHGHTKFCHEATVKPQIFARSGRWLRKKSFNGFSEASIATQIGFTWSDSESTTRTAGMSLCQATELGGESLLVKSVTTLCATMSKSTAQTTVKGNAVRQTHTDTCKPPPGAQLGAAYQYEQAIDTACWERGKCAVSALTTDILCVYDPPGSMEDFVPRCRPGTCADANCTHCSKDDGWLDDAARRAWDAERAAGAPTEALPPPPADDVPGEPPTEGDFEPAEEMVDAPPVDDEPFDDE